MLMSLVNTLLIVRHCHKIVKLFKMPFTKPKNKFNDFCACTIKVHHALFVTMCVDIVLICDILCLLCCFDNLAHIFKGGKQT